MELKTKLYNFNLNKKDFIYLICIFILSFSIFITKYLYFDKIGIPGSDSIIYLCDALYFAGMNFNNIGGLVYIYSSPTICFLTSIFFRLNYVNPNALIIVTGIFEILGNIGLYILLKNRFNRILSFVGTIFYLSSALVIYYSSSGMLDNPAVAVSIWILVFAIISIDKNPKYYLITLPLFIIGIFTRPTVGFILPIIIIYFSNKHDLIKQFDYLIYDRKKLKSNIKTFLKTPEFKYIAISCVISVILVLIVTTSIYCTYGISYKLFSNIKGALNSFQTNSTIDIYSNTYTLYYIESIPQYIFFNDLKLTCIVSIAVLIGFIVKIKNYIKSRKQTMNKNYYSTKTFENNLIAIAVFLILFSISIYKIEFLMSEIGLTIVFLIILSIMKKFPQRKLGLTISLIAWMVLYLIFISYIPIKVDRYFMPILVPISFLLIYSLDSLCNFIKEKLKYYKIKKINETAIINIALLILAVMLLMNAYSNIEYSTSHTNYNTYNDFYKNTYNGAYRDYENVTEYLMNYDSDYAHKNITTDRSKRFHDWFLNMNTTTYHLKINEYHLLDSTKSDYLIIDQKIKYENYTPIYKKGRCTLYKLNNTEII
ncbi:MAG: glycosyltransferase family 39 protein [Methanobrevibacter sp.]|nr:glycosyltransferase family 39 protein [Methanobrevibacter sp.]